MNNKLAGQFCDDILRPWKSSKADAWDEASNLQQRRKYAPILKDKPDEIYEMLVTALRKKHSWRPDPAQVEEACQEILQAVIEAKSGVTEAHATEAYLLVCRYRELYGVNAEPHPTIKGMFRAGPPRMPEVVSYAVGVLGGWEAFVTTKQSPDYERKGFESAYNAFVNGAAKRRRSQVLLDGSTQHQPKALTGSQRLLTHTATE